MTHRRPSCDAHRLNLLLDNPLHRDSQRDLEAHLDCCPVCRAQLDKLAGGDAWLTEVRRQLGGDGSGDSASDKPAKRLCGPVDLSFLDPSENSQSLGRLGAYEILEVVGRGGMGIVLKAFDAALHRPVAIKVLAAEFWANGAARKRFAREAQAVAAVIHDHVVPIHAVDAEATPPYLVMAYIPGQSLQQRIDRHGPLELKEILRIGMQTASGLAAAHAQGLVHRDIKPSNIMLENGIEKVRITDFGLARAVDDATITKSGAVAGTPAYMAPEQAESETVDQRADLFALGSVLYAMATGYPPFRGHSLLAVIRQVCDLEPKPIGSLNPAVPPWCQGIIHKLHKKAPDQRFQSAAEVADLLEHCLAHVQRPDQHALPAVARKLGRHVPTVKKSGAKRQSRWTRGAKAPLLVFSATALLFLLFARTPEPKPDPGPISPGPGVVPTDRSDKAAGLDEAIRLESGDLKAKLAAMEQSLESPPADWASPGPDFKQLSRSADRMREGLFTSPKPPPDPVAIGLESIKQRLQKLGNQLDVIPK
jgi:serine/threonine-protein kinase